MANDEMLVFKDVMSPSLRQMNKTFYSNKEIFFHELINNASNALDKIQFKRNTHKNISDDRLIRIVPHKANKTLSIIDFGIGLTKEDLAYNFGVGFYSAFLVAHKVIVTSKRNDHDQYIWESQPGAFFIVTKDINAQQPSRGTNITLFLNDNQVIPPSPFDYVADFMEIVNVYHGFGYDCVRDDYKVIRKLAYVEKTDDDDKLSHDILTVGCVWEMYSLRNNSWTNLQFGV
ncbi:hypothetical protein V8G54_023584, partial [Vigna mungo]